MNKDVQQTLASMITAMQAQLDAMRTVLQSHEVVIEQCPHNDFVSVETMGGIQGGFCNDCGVEIGMGVLDKDENSE